MRKLKKLAAFTVSIILVLSFAGCEAINDTKNNSASDSAYGKYENGIYSTDDYSIEIGKGWTKNDDYSSDKNVAVFSSTNIDGINRSINIREENYNNNTNLDFDEYMSSAVEQFNSMDDYKVTNTEKLKVDGKDAFKIYINIKSTKTKMLQCYMVDNNKVFTYSFLASSKDFNKVKDEADEILKTFKTL